MRPFTYERVKGHTGKVQFRTNGPAVANVANKRVSRGQVVAFENPRFTEGLVQTGNFAHVPADTPIGVPPLAEPEATPATTEQTSPPAPLSPRIRGFLEGRTDLPDAVARRVTELLHDAILGENVGPDAEPAIFASVARVRQQIMDEFEEIERAYPTPTTEEKE